MAQNPNHSPFERLSTIRILNSFGIRVVPVVWFSNAHCTSIHTQFQINLIGNSKTGMFSLFLHAVSLSCANKLKPSNDVLQNKFTDLVKFCTLYIFTVLQIQKSAEYRIRQKTGLFGSGF